MMSPSLTCMMSPTSHLSDELHDEVHHQLGVLVEHALPQLVHHPLAEVEDVVHQDLVAASTAEGQRGVFTWRGGGGRERIRNTETKQPQRDTHQPQRDTKRLN